MFNWWSSDGLDGAVCRGIRWDETEVFQAIEGEVEQLVTAVYLQSRSNLERITSASEYGLSWMRQPLSVRKRASLTALFLALTLRQHNVIVVL